MRKAAMKKVLAAGVAALMMGLAFPSSAFAEGQNGPGVLTEAEKESIAAEEQAKKEAEAAAAAAAREAAIDAYFDGTVMIGDSIMDDFRLYCMRKSNTWLGKLGFFSAVSFSLYNDQLPLTNSRAVHPLYKGQKRKMVDALGEMQPKRIFMFFGQNDMNTTGIQGTIDLYQKIIGQIKERVPGVDVNIINMTYLYPGKKDGNITAASAKQYNAKLLEMCNANGWGYVNMADPLSDGNGNLRPEFCSDHLSHQTNAAYNVWADVLRAYATEKVDAAQAAQ